MADNPHGTSARYNHGPAGDGVNPCRARCCLEAHNAAQRHRYRRIAYGHQLMVDAEPARAHVASLRAAGMGIGRIQTLSGVPRRSLQLLLRGRPSVGKPPTRRLRPWTAAALLAVHADWTTLHRRTPVDACGTRRRLQALVATGRSILEIAVELDMAHHGLRAIIRRRRVRCEVGTALAVRELCARWWDQPPAATTPRARRNAADARRLAANNDWAPLAAWDDIDDPDAEPHGIRLDGPVRGVDRDELVHLRAGGCHSDEIAAKLGVTVGALAQSRKRDQWAARAAAAASEEQEQAS